MKNLSYFFSMFIFLLFLSCTEEHEKDITAKVVISNSRSLDNCMPDSSDFDFATCTSSDYITTVTISDYPNCVLSIRVPRLLCYNTTTAFLVLGNIEITSSGCSGTNQFEIDRLNAINAGTTAYQNFINPILAEIYGIITPNIIASLSNLTQSVLFVEYVSAECVQTCLYEEYRGEFSYLNYIDINCGESCCKRTDLYQKENGIWVRKEIQYESNSTSCGNPVESCPNSTISSTECYGRCNIWTDF
ncbi:MAG: hypothetical protein IPJ54_18475 [Saprospiraceae bacterium]|nr:hypothetical protein [Saprospiraceae bacterium]